MCTWNIIASSYRSVLREGLLRAKKSKEIEKEGKQQEAPFCALLASPLNLRFLHADLGNLYELLVLLISISKIKYVHQSIN